MSVTVNPQYSIAAAGSTVSIACTSDAKSQSWSASGLDNDFTSAVFSPTSGASSTLRLTVNPNEASNRLNQYHSVVVTDGHSNVAVEVYVVAAGITSDDIVIIYGTDGRAYLLTEDGSHAPQLSAALQYVPTVPGTPSAVPSDQFSYVAPPVTGAGMGTVTCYLLTMSNLQTG
jgi:hypothetical protein